VTEGVITVQPSSDVTSPAYELARKRLGIAEPDSYETQATDWASLVSLAIAKAKTPTGTGIRDNIRNICQGNGKKVYSAVEGLKLLAQGTEINYEGASGPCDFTEIGDIVDCKFRYNKVADGKFVLLKVA
jgi:branched-chain amino acid transport system substrate-binding protein